MSSACLCVGQTRAEPLSEHLDDDTGCGREPKSGTNAHELNHPAEFLSENVVLEVVTPLLGTTQAKRLINLDDPPDIADLDSDSHVADLRARISQCLDAALISGTLADAVLTVAGSRVGVDWQVTSDGAEAGANAVPDNDMWQCQADEVILKNIFPSSRSVPRTAQDDILARAVSRTSSRIKIDFARLSSVQHFKQSLSTTYNEFTHDCVAVELSHARQRFDEFILLATSSSGPQITAKPQCGLICQATMRARTGIGGAGIFCNQVIVEALSSMADDCASFSKFCLEMDSLFQGVASHMTKHAEGILRILEAYEGIDSGDNSPVDRHANVSGEKSCNTSILQDELNITAFNEHILKLVSFPHKVYRVKGLIAERVAKIKSFIQKAPREVNEACQLPFPLNTMQRIVLGDQPALMDTLLDKLREVDAIDFDKVLCTLQKLIDGLNALQCEVIMQLWTAFVVQAGVHVGKLEHDIAYAHLCNEIAEDETCPSARFPESFRAYGMCEPVSHEAEFEPL